MPRTNTLYLVRHGENPANITKEFSYKLVDYSLTPKGQLQAEQTALFFREMPIDAIYSSPLKRAHETALSIAQPHQLPVALIEGFREVNVGDLERMPPAEASWRLHDEIIADWRAGKQETSFPGGENYLELVERLRQGLLEATRERDNQCIVIAAHGGSITSLILQFCPDISGTLNYSTMHNCAITKVELTTDGNELTGSLRSWASISHLSGEAANVISPVLEYEKTQR